MNGLFNVSDESDRPYSPFECIETFVFVLLVAMESLMVVGFSEPALVLVFEEF